MTGPRSSNSASAAASSPVMARIYAIALVVVLSATFPAAAQTGGGNAEEQAGAPAAGGAAPPANPIGVVDMAAILQRSSAIAQIREAIDNQNTLFEEEISKEEVAIKEAERQLNEDRDVITEQEFNERLAEFEKRVVDLQRQIQLQRSGFDRAYADAQNRLEEQMLLIISELARERGFALVVQKKNAVIYDSTLDITEEALARLNDRTKNLKITLERKDNP